MNLDNLNTHYVLLEERGFITNCPPESELSIWHDEVYKYCEHLNELALSRGDYFEPPFDSVHLNEPVGDYISIYKVEGTYEEKAMDVLNTHANKRALEEGVSRHW